MPTESGDMKLLGNFRKLIDFVSADLNYKPANTKIAVAGLETIYTLGQSVATNVRTTEGPYKVAVNTRQERFAQVPQRAGSAFRMAKALGAQKPILDDLNTYRRKLNSQRKTKIPKDDPNTPVDESGGSKTHSVSQMSYDNQVGNVDSFFELLSNIPSYNPNEDELKITSLKAFAAQLKAVNEAVSTSFVPLSQARGTRDQVLYTGDDSIVNIALLVKAYVSAAFGRDSALYKNIKGLKFERKRESKSLSEPRAVATSPEFNGPGQQESQGIAECPSGLPECTNGPPECTNGPAECPSGPPECSSGTPECPTGTLECLTGTSECPTEISECSTRMSEYRTGPPECPTGTPKCPTGTSDCPTEVTEFTAKVAEWTTNPFSWKRGSSHGNRRFSNRRPLSQTRSN